MADINVQMPSENEDFDATTSGAQTVSPTTTAEATPAVSSETPDFSQPTVAAPAEPAAAEVTAPEAAAPAPAAEAEVPAEPAVTEEPAAVTPPAEAVKGPRKALPILPILVGVLTLAVLGLGFYSFTLMNAKKDVDAKLAAAYANPQALVQKQTDDLIAKVGQLMKLPQGETPTVANVSDAAKAKQQSAFFTNAQNGDRVLMYVKAGQAILYRPSTNKIVLVAPLTFNNNTPAATTPTKK